MVFLGAEVLVPFPFADPVALAVCDIPPVLRFVWVTFLGVVVGVAFELVVCVAWVVVWSCRTTKPSTSGRKLGHAFQAETVCERDSARTAKWPKDRVVLMVAAGISSDRPSQRQEEEMLPKDPKRDGKLYSKYQIPGVHEKEGRKKG